jgi:hypothetical protein
MAKHHRHEKESMSSTGREGEGEKNGTLGETKIKGSKRMKVLAIGSTEKRSSTGRI